jgi:hypothetical protein
VAESKITRGRARNAKQKPKNGRVISEISRAISEATRGPGKIPRDGQEAGREAGEIAVATWLRSPDGAENSPDILLQPLGGREVPRGILLPDRGWPEIAAATRLGSGEISLPAGQCSLPAKYFSRPSRPGSRPAEDFSPPAAHTSEAVREHFEETQFISLRARVAQGDGAAVSRRLNLRTRAPQPPRGCRRG